ncbi:MAG TPA: tyrosine-type recombinase/integrase [Candidatus Mediterraneibacter stercoripullorum]|nr:tyrosine-type recombinase/integrase [Candidatus Mediterraneibacter stercoripullorum]
MRRNEVELRREQIEEFRQYLYERENARATIQKYISDIETFFNYLAGEAIVDKQKLLDYKEWLLRRYAVSSANSMLAALNQFLEFLELDFLKVKRIKVQKSLFLQEEKELTREEYRKLVQTALAEGKEQLALCMETIASTGIRISELEFFTVESIRRDYIEIVNKGKYRRIFLPKVLRQKLLFFARKNGIRRGAIFITRTGKKKCRSNIWREMKALKEKAGINGNKIFPHNLRHLFARTYYSITKDLAGLGDLLGHSSLNVTRIYTSNTGKIYQKQLDLLGDIQIKMTT